MSILTADDLEKIAGGADGVIYAGGIYAADGSRATVLRSFHASFLRGRVAGDVDEVRRASPGEEMLWSRGTGPFLISREKTGFRSVKRSLLINESRLTSRSFAEGAGQLAVTLGATQSDAREMASSMHEAQMGAWRTARQPDPKHRPIAPDLNAISGPERRLSGPEVGR